MFLKKDTLTLNDQKVTLHELSALQRAEYFDFLADKEASITEGENDFKNNARLMKFNIEVNAWLVSRSLWHTEPEREESEIQQEVMRTWSTQGLNQAVEMVLELSGMTPKAAEAVEAVEQPEQVEDKVAEPRKLAK